MSSFEHQREISVDQSVEAPNHVNSPYFCISRIYMPYFCILWKVYFLYLPDLGIWATAASERSSSISQSKPPATSNHVNFRLSVLYNFKCGILHDVKWLWTTTCSCEQLHRTAQGTVQQTWHTTHNYTMHNGTIHTCHNTQGTTKNGTMHNGITHKTQYTMAQYTWHNAQCTQGTVPRTLTTSRLLCWI